MFKFPQNLYTDIRIEDVFQTNIVYNLENLDECKVRKYKAAFIRIFDGERWYYSSTSELSNIQNEIDGLALFAKPNVNIHENPTVKNFEINKGSYLKFKDTAISATSKEDKINLLLPYTNLLKRPLIKRFKLQYIDERKIKEFYSSKGASLTFDTQRCGISINFNMSAGEKQFSEGYQKSSCYFSELLNKEEECTSHIKECEHFLINSVPVIPSKYTVILSPLAAGVFAHESFGHKSESDFMIGDENMKKEWSIGSKVGSDILSILDDGGELSSGFTPFDDEGTSSKTNYLINKGILSGRLHNSFTSASLEEKITGNGRALNFEFEPIVRMTTTYIAPGDKTKEELIGEVANGILIETIKHGSGMSTFTLAPSRSYLIEDGKITKPVNISVVTGTIFDTLKEIDGLSNKLEILSFVTGGCGKLEQYPLPVGFGGPYVRVKNMNVQ